MASRAPMLSVPSVVIGVLLVTAGKAAAQLQPPPAPPENPITEQKRALGKVLFWDEQLSTSNTVSCGTCHSHARGGSEPRNAAIDPGGAGAADDTFGSPGVSLSNVNNDYIQSAVFGTNPQATSRFSMAAINAGFAPDLFWDGRARSQFVDPETGQVAIASGGGLESQVVGPPLSDVEMAHQGTDWASVSEKLRTVRPLDLATNIPADLTNFLNMQGVGGGRASYPELFRRAFGTTDISARRIAFAIATYERTLVSNQTPWDSFIAGNPNAMTPNQVQGWNNFQAPTTRCNVCHVPPLFSGNGFRNIGLRPIAEDNGRQAVTGLAVDAGRFKVPSLRNVGLRTRFMHTGTFTTLGQVLGFYDQGPGAPVMFPQNLDPVVVGINAPPPVANPIIDFISNALTDPRVAAEQFPFDRPTLAADRPTDRPTTVANTGVAGLGGVPQIIVQAPGLLHSLTFRVGLSGARANANAQLGVSRTAPVNGRITPEFFAQSAGVSAGGFATAHSFLSIRDYAPGTVLFYQWFIADPAAAGGQAASTVGRVPVFCGSGGCPGPCDSIDFNRDGLIPDTADIDDFLSVFSGGPCSTGACADVDFNNDGLFPDTEDLNMLLSVFSGGPCL